MTAPTSTTHLTDDQLEAAIAEAMEKSDSEGLAELIALRDSLPAESALAIPAMAQLWEAILEITSRSGDEAASLPYAEEHARWLASVLGPAEPETLEAWLAVGDSAEQEMQWDVATRAWEAVIAAVQSSREVDAARPSISRALRGLGTRRLVDKRLDEARALFERDLALVEQLHPGHPQVAISLDNLALVLERQGDLAAALATRQRQRDALIDGRASAGQLHAVEQHIARLDAAA